MSDICLVVGAGPGIGRSVGLAFARHGFDIALAARDARRLQPYCDEIQRLSGQRAQAYAADAGDPQSLRGLFEQVRQQGMPEVVVYNAAQSHRGRATTVPPQQWLDDYRLNVVGAAVCAQLAAETMRPRGHGSLLFTGGGFAHEPSAPYASLSAGKAALRNLTYSLAQELGGSGIHVATVTVYGLLQAGTHFDPERIADEYVRLHNQTSGNFEIEAIYK